MIVFDLRCPAGHVFEAWFGTSAAYETQRAQAMIACPICGDARIEKAVMAPNLAAKGNRAAPPAAAAATQAPPPPEAVKAAIARLAGAQARLLENSSWVGKSFPERARAMHLGEEPAAPIHGQATPSEARALADDGVALAPLPLPVVPPGARN